MPANGIEIVECGGKANIPSLYRLFTAFHIDCYCLFDADESKITNTELKSLLNISSLPFGTSQFYAERQYAYFSKDYESTVSVQITNYLDLEEEAKSVFKATRKPEIAHIIATLSNAVPVFIDELISRIIEEEANETVNQYKDESTNSQCNPESKYSDRIPF